MTCAFRKGDKSLVTVYVETLQQPVVLGDDIRQPYHPPVRDPPYVAMSKDVRFKATPRGMGSTVNADAQAQGAYDGMGDAQHGGVVRFGLVVPSLDRRLHHRHVVTTVTGPKPETDPPLLPWCNYDRSVKHDRFFA